MDIKLKGIAWVDDFCQKFESMCNEVDHIIKEVKVKFVESQVQTVGGNLKKLYSGVFNEFVPPPVHPDKHKTQLVPKKSDADVIHSETVIGVEENPKGSLSKKFHLDPNHCTTSELDAVENLLDHGIHDEPKIDQDDTPISVDFSEIPKSDSNPFEFDDTKTAEGFDATTENISTQEWSPALELLQLTAPEEKASSNASSFYDFSDSNLENMTGLASTEESPAMPIHVEEFQSSQKEGADVYDSSEMNVSHLPCYKRVVERGLQSSIGSLSLESCTALENSIQDNSTTGMPSNDPVDMACSVSESPNALHNLTTGSSAPQMNYIAENGLLDSGVVLPTESSGPLDDCYEDINEADMETIDLGDNVEVEDSSIFADDSELYAASQRTRKLRSYKKKILDVFSSRKRIVKEYEQIAVWYGDVDVGTRQDASHALRQPTSTTALGLENSASPHISDWEIL